MPTAWTVRPFVIALMLLLVCSPLAADTPAEERSSPLWPLVRLLGQVDDAAIQRDVLSGIHAAVEGRRRLTMPEGWPEAARRLHRSADDQARQEALALSLVFGDAEAAAALRAIVTDGDKPPEQRTDALRTLVQSRRDEVVPLLHELLDDETLRSAALNGLAAFDDPATPRLVLQHYPSLPAVERSDAIAALASRPAYAIVLLRAVETGDVSSRDISAFAARQLM
ncbi:MAG: HEAT repeat domain-containing protein, partial [Planctomycetaceae bacterium]